LFSTDRQAESSDFGIELNAGTIRQHLHDLRRKRSQYIKDHPRETKNLIP
jgi:hypothetical protein